MWEGVCVASRGRGGSSMWCPASEPVNTLDVTCCAVLYCAAASCLLTCVPQPPCTSCHTATRNDPAPPLQKGSTWWGTYDFDSPAFDWGTDYNRPTYSLSELVIYEMSVRCFTASETSGVEEERRGTYLGVADKVIKRLCVGGEGGREGHLPGCG